MATTQQRRQAIWKRTDRRAVADQRALAERIGLIIMRAASATNEAGDRAIPPSRTEVARLDKVIWSTVLKPYFIGPSDEPLDGPRPQSPFADLVVDGIREAVTLEAQEQVKLTRRVLRTVDPELAGFLIDGDELREDRLFELTAGPSFTPDDYRDPTTGKIDPAAARRAFVRPRGTYDPFHRFVDPGGYRLSDRVWRSGLGERRAIDRFMEYHISRGTSAVEMARTLEVFLTGGAAAAKTPKPYGTNGSYAARRLARTEITAAAGRATIAMSEANPMVGGVRWVLSRSHKDLDECDQNASGGPNGDGVYPPGDVPRYPNHPHELCTLSPQAADNIEDVVKSIRKRVRRARNEFTNAITGGTAASPEVRQLKRLLSPKKLAEAALTGTLDQTIADIARKFVRPSVPLASAPSARKSVAKTEAERAAVRIVELKEKLRFIDSEIIFYKKTGDRNKVLSLQSSKSRFKKKLREAEGLIIVEPTPAPKPRPAPAPKPTPTPTPRVGTPPAIVTPIPTGTDAEQLVVVRQNIVNMKRERFLLSKEMAGATHKRAGEIRTRAKALTEAIKRQEGYVTNILARTPIVAPTPTPEPAPTPKADPQVTKLQTKMADLYARLDVAKASGDKKKIASVQSSLSVTRRKLRALGAEPIAPGGTVPTPAPTPRITLPPPQPRPAPKPIPEPKIIVTKATIIKQRAGAGAKERVTVYQDNIAALQTELASIDRRIFQGPGLTEGTRLLKRRAAVEKLLIKNAAGLAKAEARLAKSPSARRAAAGFNPFQKPTGPEVTLDAVKPTSKLSKVKDHRVDNLTSEASDLHDETWKQARRLREVHNVPSTMTSMDVYAKNTFGSGSSAQGQYHPVGKTATINSNQLEAGNRFDKGAINLTTWHEIGHGMDYQWMGASSKAKNWGQDVMGRTNVSPKVVAARDKLMKTLMDSSRVVDLIDSVTTGEFRGLTAPSAKYMGYASSEVEVFARGYSQYAAEVLQDADALKYCKKRSTSRSWGFGHWTAKEFEPLKIAFDEFFEAAGMSPT